ncbi:MAG: hypothetical protein ACE5FT_00375 [Candidatus Nanoarchaeia archaeon]
MRRVWIIKANGEKAWYNRRKLFKTCRRSGASTKACNAAIEKVERVLKDGMRTKDILKIMMGGLEKHAPYHAPRYDLKGAIMRLGPAGFHFEKLTAELLQKYGYSTTTNAELQGKCVKQEVDIIAIKNKKCHMIECKFHHQSGIYTGLKETMYTWARFEDLVDGYKTGTCDKFHVPWLISNTKFSNAAMQYGPCKGVKITGWQHPAGESYQDLLEKKDLYPITSIKITRQALASFAKGNIMFLRDLCELSENEVMKRTKLGRHQLNKYRDLAGKILNTC